MRLPCRNFDEGEGWTVHDITGKVGALSCSRLLISRQSLGEAGASGSGLNGAVRCSPVLTDGCDLAAVPPALLPQGHDLHAAETPRWEVVRWLSVCGNGAWQRGTKFTCHGCGGVPSTVGSNSRGSEPGWTPVAADTQDAACGVA